MGWEEALDLDSSRRHGPELLVWDKPHGSGSFRNDELDGSGGVRARQSFEAWPRWWPAGRVLVASLDVSLSRFRGSAATIGKEGTKRRRVLSLGFSKLGISTWWNRHALPCLQLKLAYAQRGGWMLQDFSLWCFFVGLLYIYRI